LVRFVNKVYLKVAAIDDVILQWTRVVEKRAATRGAVDAITFVKNTRVVCLRYLAGSPILDGREFGIELDQKGLPPLLAPLFEGRDPPRLRLGFTLLGISRLIPGWKSPDLTSITDPCQTLIPHNLGEELAGVVRALGWRITQPVWEECHVSTKSGPNAQALVSSIEDAHLLSDQQISDLLVVGGSELVKTIEVARSLSLLTWLSKFVIKTRKGERGLAPKGLLSRISAVKDKEAKCRIVAILDYWTQSALYPLHDALMSFLRSMRTDMTFNQGGFLSVLPKEGPYYSVDLSSATDRMPVAIQVPVLEALGLSAEYVASWRRLIIDRDYTYSFGPHKRGAVRYAVGQPMGAYSSWTAFSVTHHAIVRLAAQRAGLGPAFEGYVILGDDIVIANGDVYREYLAIVSSVGVSISEAKSIVAPSTFEFAKRYIHNGNEVTGAPFGSLFEGVKWAKLSKAERDGSRFLPVTKLVRSVSFYHVATWFKELEARWLPRNDTMVSRGLLADFFMLFGKGSRLYEKAWRFFLLPSRDDGKTLRRWKADTLGAILLGRMLGCATKGKSYERIVWLLSECKARVLESAIKEQAKRLHGFFSEERNWIDMFPEGSDAQSLLRSLPPFAVLRGNIAKLQLEMDKARRIRTSDKKRVWLKLDLDLQLFLDPFAAISARKSKVVAMNKVTVLNHMVATARQITLVRELALTEIGADALKPVFATIFQGPKGRGAARDPRRSVGPAIIIRHSELE
jgi:hypothetical protein